VHDFADYAAALKLELPTVAPVPPEEAARDAALAAAVRKHYVQNRPGPESFPSMALQVITLLGRDDADIGRLAQLIARDPGLTASLLRVVNSAIFRGVQRVASVRDAIARLGLNEAGRVAGAAAARALFDARGREHTQPFVADFEMLYVHAVTCAVTSGWLATQRGGAHADRCYLGGLLHDIGRSIALRSAAALRTQGFPDFVPRSPRTHRVLELLHSSLGADVLTLWQLPEFVIEFAGKHHASGLASGEGDPDLHIIALTSALQLLRVAPALHPGAAEDLLVSARALGLTPTALMSIDAERARFERLARSLATG
jgi:putative nucleotidyltransferase with HDIG domain